MSLLSFPVLHILFVVGFTLHNIEEALFLPAWSRSAGKFHAPVEKVPFLFAVGIVTIIGYALAFLDLASGKVGLWRYLFVGYAGMMGLNAIFPHAIATLFLKRYAPGLATALILNFPLSVAIIYRQAANGLSVLPIALATVAVSAVILSGLPGLFKLGRMVQAFLRAGRT